MDHHDVVWIHKGPLALEGVKDPTNAHKHEKLRNKRAKDQKRQNRKSRSQILGFQSSMSNDVISHAGSHHSLRYAGSGGGHSEGHGSESNRDQLRGGTPSSPLARDPSAGWTWSTKEAKTARRRSLTMPGEWNAEDRAATTRMHHHALPTIATLRRAKTTVDVGISGGVSGGSDAPGSGGVGEGEAGATPHRRDKGKERADAVAAESNDNQHSTTPDLVSNHDVVAPPSAPSSTTTSTTIPTTATTTTTDRSAHSHRQPQTNSIHRRPSARPLLRNLKPTASAQTPSVEVSATPEQPALSSSPSLTSSSTQSPPTASPTTPNTDITSTPQQSSAESVLASLLVVDPPPEQNAPLSQPQSSAEVHAPQQHRALDTKPSPQPQSSDPIPIPNNKDIGFEECVQPAVETSTSPETTASPSPHASTTSTTPSAPISLPSSTLSTTPQPPPTHPLSKSVPAPIVQSVPKPIPSATTTNNSAAHSISAHLALNSTNQQRPPRPSSSYRQKPPQPRQVKPRPLPTAKTHSTVQASNNPRTQQQQQQQTPAPQPAEPSPGGVVKPDASTETKNRAAATEREGAAPETQEEGQDKPMTPSSLRQANGFIQKPRPPSRPQRPNHVNNPSWAVASLKT
eukprot:TRINITY_DN5359_c0_g1_i1.p1 TRINITY_DN5359_c0_g1~~TRINITY_DN5359_c0_g1_i1.p1  ORF type:complete len:627 (-),score=138.65 TRINITY_DN5359_c0_g1_i1:90-1970(-)